MSEPISIMLPPERVAMTGVPIRELLERTGGKPALSDYTLGALSIVAQAQVVADALRNRRAVWAVTVRTFKTDETKEGDCDRTE